MDRKREGLKVEISKLSTSDACDFAAVFDAMMDRAYCHALCEAAPSATAVVATTRSAIFVAADVTRAPASSAGVRIPIRSARRRSKRVKEVAGSRPGATIRTRPSGHERCDAELPALCPRLVARLGQSWR
jgi:hypothetical protein